MGRIREARRDAQKLVSALREVGRINVGTAGAGRAGQRDSPALLEILANTRAAKKALRPSPAEDRRLL